MRLRKAHMAYTSSCRMLNSMHVDRHQKEMAKHSTSNLRADTTMPFELSAGLQKKNTPSNEVPSSLEQGALRLPQVTVAVNLFILSIKMNQAIEMVIVHE